AGDCVAGIARGGSARRRHGRRRHSTGDRRPGLCRGQSRAGARPRAGRRRRNGLTAVSAELADLGMKCAAADAAAQAAKVFAARHERKGEVEAMARAAELAGGASTPALDQVLNPLPLTGRELEIAIMVSDGMTNKAIAERLSVSVRTVEGHIYRACTKLDVPDRTMLAEVVSSAKTSTGLRKPSSRSPSTL